MAETVKAKAIREYLHKVGSPFRQKPKEDDEEEMLEEEEEKKDEPEVKLKDLPKRKKVPQGFIDIAKSFRNY